MAKRKQTEYINGTAQHRRTVGDYMGVLPDKVTLNDRRSVVNGALPDCTQIIASCFAQMAA